MGLCAPAEVLPSGSSQSRTLPRQVREKGPKELIPNERGTRAGRLLGCLKLTEAQGLRGVGKLRATEVSGSGNSTVRTEALGWRLYAIGDFPSLASECRA